GDVVDLHGYSAAVAKAAIRSGLKRLLRRFLTADPAVVRDFTIITGQGKHSRRAFEPVLRPAAQDMFLEEFDPPIVSRFEPKNLGRLKVGREGGGGAGGREGRGRRAGGGGRGQELGPA
ncbi:unnamed protein product, partial [Laminaria digitata]